MKIIATFLLFLFAFLQAGQVAHSLFSDNAYDFTISDTKEDKSEKVKKDTKDFIAYTHNGGEFIHFALIPSHHVERILPSPSLENLTPPPNIY